MLIKERFRKNYLKGGQQTFEEDELPDTFSQIMRRTLIIHIKINM